VLHVENSMHVTAVLDSSGPPPHQLAVWFMEACKFSPIFMEFRASYPMGQNIDQRDQ
jgi:hypothetical protein